LDKTFTIPTDATPIVLKELNRASNLC